MLSVPVLIVGAGMAGLSLALELHRRGMSDLLVASAGRSDGTSVAASAGARPWCSVTKHFRPVPGMDWRIGGRSLCWHGVTVAVHANDLRRWPAPLSDRLMGSGSGSYAQTMSRLQAWRGEPLDSPTCPGEAALPGLLAEHGLNLSVVPRAAVSEVDGDGQRVWRAYSPLDDLVRVPPDRLLAGYRAVTIEVHDGLFRTVLVGERGDVVTIRSRCLVLATGTLENARLYAQLTARVTAMPIVWPGLVTTMKHGLTALPPPGLRRWLRSGEFVFLMERFPELWGNLFVELSADGGAPLLELWWLAAMADGEEALLRFTQDGSEGWRGEISAEIGPRGAAMIRNRDRVTRALARSLGCRVPTASGQVAAIPRRVARRRTLATGEPHSYLNTLGGTHHESGTLAVGRELGPDFMSTTVDGLFVGGPAAFPRLGPANPGLSVLALAAVLADGVGGYLRRTG